MVGELALKVPFPRQDRLFVEIAAYDWRIKDDLSICYYWTGRFKEGYALGVELLNNPNIPPDHKSRIEKNTQHCKEKLDEK